MDKVLQLVCSYRPRPTTVSRKKDGTQWWTRDVHHTQGPNQKTLCGIPTTGWITINNQSAETTLQDQNLCKKCRRKILQEKASHAKTPSHE